MPRPDRPDPRTLEGSPDGDPYPAVFLAQAGSFGTLFESAQMMQEHTMPGGYVLYSVELVKRWRITAAEFLEGSGYTLEGLSDPRTRVPIETIVKLIIRARALTGEPAYGYYLGMQMGVAAHGLLGMAAMSAPTMREGIDLAIRFIPILTTAISLRLEVNGGEASLILTEHADFGAARESVVLAALIGLWRIGVMLSGRDPTGYADLALPEPEYYSHLLLIGSGRLRFNQPVHRLTFEAASLDSPYSMADPVLLQLAREQCERILASRGPDARAGARVRSLAMLGKGPPLSLEHVAHIMRTSPRTLKRQLAAEGTSFSAIIDAERHERALFLLRVPGASLKDVANRLGYANIANFTRAFQRWTGLSPSEHRAALTSRGRER